MEYYGGCYVKCKQYVWGKEANCKKDRTFELILQRGAAKQPGVECKHKFELAKKLCIFN
jgi:hypothetical protein